MIPQILPTLAERASTAIMLLCVIASLAGFLACAIILAAQRCDPRGDSTMRRSVACWGMVFFFGASAITLDGSMGDRAPLPIAVGNSAQLGLGAIAFAWALFCAACFAARKAYRYATAVEGAQRAACFRAARLACLFALSLTLLACGGCAGDAAFVNAEDATQRAIGPEYTRYVTADATLSPDQKARRQRTVAIWRSAIDEHQAAIAGGNPLFGVFHGQSPPVSPSPAPATQPSPPSP